MNDKVTKPDFEHLQISLRLPHWIVTRIDGIAAKEFSNRASVLRRLLAHELRRLEEATSASKNDLTSA
jgi:metal-responsive CopG/Arc/MetJ family transcriptional regulator